MPAVQRPASQAPQRQRTRVFPTPKIADVIIRQVFESTRTTVPAYGTAHPDTAKYPNHKLVHAKVIDEQGLFLELWYAADRSNQEDYNYSLTYPYGGNPAYPRITRTYILPRSPDPLALGSTDPGGSMFGIEGYRRPDSTSRYRRPDGTSQYFRTSLPAGVLVAQSERPLGDELNGLYVEVTRVYDVIPGLEDQVSSDGLGQTDDGYSVERPMQDKDWIRLTWKIVLPRTIADTYRRDNFDVCPIPRYQFLYLVDERIQVNEESNQTSTIVRVYEGDQRDTKDTSDATIVGKNKQYPGIIPPEKFLLETESKQLTKRILSPESIDLDGNSIPADFTLVESKVDPEGTNSGSKTVVATSYNNIAPLNGKQWDNETRSYIPYTVQVIPASEALSFPEPVGAELSIQPINRYWSIVTTETPSSTSTSLRSYYSTTPFSWPAVLPSSGQGALKFDTIKRKDRRTGELTGEEVLWYDFELIPAWSGICKTFVEIGWSPTPPDFVPIQTMNPTEIIISWPVGSLKIPKCLHTTYTFKGSTGTENPDWDFADFKRIVPATNYETWPESIVADFDVTPYKGGFRTRKITVFRPYNPVLQF
jgi:hypothetical protein